jgi:hypothetical protein
MSASPHDQNALATARRLTLEGTAARVIRALGDAGVRAVLLKGPTLSELYGGTRHYSDIDVLVGPESAAAAEAVLGGLGFELRHDDPHSRIWSRAGLDVDLHMTLIGAHADPARIWEALGRETEPFRLADTAVVGLNRAGRALHVTLHAAQHGTEEAKPREDLRRALDLYSEDTWTEAARLAVELDAQAAFWNGLAMEPAGREIQARLELTRGETRTETELRASTPPPTAVGLLRLAETPGLGAKAGLVWREAFPSAAFLRNWSPLARRGAVGLALAYVWRPIWMLVRLGPAFAAIMRARRVARKRRPPE